MFDRPDVYLWLLACWHDGLEVAAVRRLQEGMLSSTPSP
jgi:hypothetical protein